MASVEDRKGHEVENAEVDIEDDDEGEEAHPAVFGEEEIVHHFTDADWSGEVLDSDVGAWGNDLGDGDPHGAQAIAHLLEGVRVNDVEVDFGWGVLVADADECFLFVVERRDDWDKRDERDVECLAVANDL